MSMFAERWVFTTVRYPVGSFMRVNRAPLLGAILGGVGGWG